MTATSTSRAPRRPRIRSRAPPPTPIRTARGVRSAAADELVLAEFLEASQRVPALTLPVKKKRFDFPAPPPAPDIPAHDLLTDDPAAARTAVTAAEEAGAFRVGGAIGVGEVRAAMEAAEAVFGAPEVPKREIGRLFRGRDRVVGEELYLPWPVTADMDRLLEAALPRSTYRAFREKMDVVASKMEDLARCVVRVLSDNAKNPRDAALPREAPSVLCLTLYNCNKLKTSWGGFGSTERPNSYALSAHLSGRDQEICLRNQGGSTFFNLPAGSVLVTVGKQIQEWSNGEFKSAIGEILFELTDEPNPFMSLELLYSPGDLNLGEVSRHASSIDRPKIVPLRDQILIALVLLILYYLFWR
ncbi:uncharacterized protein [Lolium perenne]|uniref:uncharacterized protein n=1 Tax=Lolium perenne TaxID=4522 RepID=UPI0021F55B9D|nr:uncharacterized protein LOC127344779 isoform X1 [Lolium perenne]